MPPARTSETVHAGAAAHGETTAPPAAGQASNPSATPTHVPSTSNA